jgi:hypothetical protein
MAQASSRCTLYLHNHCLLYLHNFAPPPASIALTAKTFRPPALCSTG